MLAQFVYNLTRGLQRERVIIAAKDLDIAPALTGNTPYFLRRPIVSATAPLLAFRCLLGASTVMHQRPGFNCSNAEVCVRFT